MYYHTPKLLRYIYWLKRWQLALVLVYLLLAVLALMSMSVHFIDDDDAIWIKSSSKHASHRIKIERLAFTVNRFDQSSMKRLYALKKELEAVPAVLSVKSIFDVSIFQSHGSDASQSIEPIQLQKLSLPMVLHTFLKYKQLYEGYFSDDFKTYYFYLYHQDPIDLQALQERIPFTMQHKSSTLSLQDIVKYLLIFTLFLAFVFRSLFHSFVPFFASITVISLTSIFTLWVINYLFALETIHIAMMLIIISIALVDMMFFYYRWHVSHYRHDSTRALLKMTNRNLFPAMWTTLLTILGVGSLLFVDSPIVRLLSATLMSASVITYIINITLLPVMLNHFDVIHPKCLFARFCYQFANAELHHNRLFLGLFIIASLSIMLFGIYTLVNQPEKLFNAPLQENKMVLLSTSAKDLNVTLLQNLEQFEKEMKNSVSGVKEVYSFASMTKSFQALQHDSNMTEQLMLQTRFFLELYDKEQYLLHNDKAYIFIFLSPSTKIADFLYAIKRQTLLPLHIEDEQTNILEAKYSNVTLLAFSLALAIVMIALFMGFIFRNKNMIVVAFLVNALPVAWFGFYMHLLHVPFSLEMITAMTLSVGLASDATVHFAFKYMRNRYFGKSQKHSLEVMFFYSGVPVVISALMLMVLFLLLSLSPVQSLASIGLYGAILMLFSLVVDLFILPILLLKLEKRHAFF